MIFGLSIKELIAAAGGLTAVVGGVIYLAKWAVWKFKKTPEEKREEVAKKNDDEENDFRKTGRPQ